MPDWLPLSLKHLLWRVGDERYIDPLLAGPLNTIRAEYGLPPTSRFFDAWIHAPDRVVGLFPDWFGDPQPDWPEQVRCTGFPLYDRVNDERLADEVIRFLEAGEPPVVFTAGTAMRRGRDFYAAAVDACWRLNGRGILLTRYPEQIPTPLPDTVRHFTYVPLSLLLPHAAVIVHHAGIGTSSQALRAGVPQLLRPMAYDQFDNAHRLEQLGVGLIIDRRRSTGSRMAGKLHILINQLSYREAAQRIADRFTGQDPIAESCDLIEETRD
jgi:UDP:flavonoid glycosyltransferase YjiC (YdhE family)